MTTMGQRQANVIASFEEWLEAFRPVRNHFHEDAPLGGFMFETFGEELAYVNNWPADRIWTFVSGDGGEYIISGAHFVNRLGYLLTSVSVPKEVESVEVRIDL